jgi:hypothetical protein
MRNARAVGIVVAAFLVLPAAPAFTQTVVWCVDLEGAQETPPAASAGSGTGLLTYDLDTNVLTYNISFSGLGSPEIMAHIHGPAPRGEAAGILFTLPLGSPKVGQWDVPEAQEADLLAGMDYVNIHTVLFGNGEIRGQIDLLGASCDVLFADGFETSS